MIIENIVFTEQDREALQTIINFVEGKSGQDHDHIVDAAQQLAHLICQHQCWSNCRREGCNCICGEWHGVTD